MQKTNAPRSILLSDAPIDIPGHARHGTSFPDDNFHGMLPYDNASISEIIIPETSGGFEGPQTQKIFRECRRILKPGGKIRLCINTPPGIALRNLQNELADYAGFCGLMPPQAFTASHRADQKILEMLGNPGLILEILKPIPETNKNPLVSLLIPAFRSDFFKICVDSCLRQTYSNIEIIVLDDSPNDRIGELTREFQALDPRISYIRNRPALGEAENLMKGIRLSSGELIKPVCDDDELSDDAVEQLLNALNKAPGATLATGQRQPIDATGSPLSPDLLGKPLSTSSGQFDGRMVIEKILATRINYLGEPTAMMFRKSDALAVREKNIMTLHGFPCVGLGDVCTAIHLLSKGDLAYVALPVCKFRMHQGQTQKQGDTRKEYVNTWKHLQLKAAEFGFTPPAKESALTGTPFEQAYQQWQRLRALSEKDIKRLANEIAELDEEGWRFQIFIRVPDGHETLLAETLDSLNRQHLGTWQLDILTQIPAPDGLEEIPCIAWHTLTSLDEAKPVMDAVVKINQPDWVLELPAGARLDPLYLWRISVEAGKSEGICCFFVDDDCFDTGEQTFAPRFKPGVNPAAMESADLAGPVCMTRQNWNAIGGASPHSASPWFHQLLLTARSLGWQSIGHIPDVLISYPMEFPSDPKTCVISVLEYVDHEKTGTEIVPATGKSWNIRYRLNTLPNLTLAVLSRGRLELLQRCLQGLTQETRYPREKLQLRLVLAQDICDADLEDWLETFVRSNDSHLEVIRPSPGNLASLCNAASQSATGEFIVFLDEEACVIDPEWLKILVSTCAQSGVGGATPCIVRPDARSIHHAGLVLGVTAGDITPESGPQAGTPLPINKILNGIAAPLYEKSATQESAGYLSSIKAARDVSALSTICMLIRLDGLRAAGGFDDENLGDYFADIDLALKLRDSGLRLIYQPLSSIGFGDVSDIAPAPDPLAEAGKAYTRLKAREYFYQRWWPRAAVDPLWSPNLSLSSSKPAPTPHAAIWDRMPLDLPRILAHPLQAGQGAIRLGIPVQAVHDRGLAQASIHVQRQGEPNIPPADLLRMKPDVLIVHQYVNNTRLAELNAWHRLPARPFMVYAMDDLLTQLDETNPMRVNIPPDSRTRLKYALEHCDRLVVSTDYLAESYRNLIADIRVVPNLIPGETWLSLPKLKRTSVRPRIGWAGGTTHQGDLVLLKEVIEATRTEADWIFFGMCPEDIKPLLAEYHPLVKLSEYPAYLAGLNLDIAVAPLAETPFNRGKSNLRLLEYGILGLPVVCTDIDPYRNSPACCVPNNAKAWITALRERIHDVDAREAEGKRMHHWVSTNFLLEFNLPEWLASHLPISEKKH